MPAMSCSMRSWALALVLGALTASAKVSNFTEVQCNQEGARTGNYRWKCGIGGCVDDSTKVCSTADGQKAMTQALCTAKAGSFTWNATCGCICQVKVCEFGCFDTEDEMCLANTNEMGCAEIYGHVEWSQVCNCRFGNELVGSQTASAGDVNLYFSVPAFVVLFRESLEVVIVLVIIIQFLTKSMQDGVITKEQFFKFRREVYVGASAGFGVCMAFGVGFLALASMFRRLFKGDNLRYFDGFMMLITSVVLSFLAVNFYKMIHTKEAHERKMRERIEQTVQATKEAEEQGRSPFAKKHAFLILAFSTGLREGLESVIFLIGVVSDVKDLSSLPIPIVTALVLARLVGCCFFQGTKGMRVDWFMRVSAAILACIAAGFFSQSMHKFQEMDWFGTWTPKSDRPWQNEELFDASECCNDKTNRFFVLVRAMLGWQDKPSAVEFFAYAAYWAVAAVVGTFCVRRAKRQIEARIKEWRALDEAEPNKSGSGSDLAEIDEDYSTDAKPTEAMPSQDEAAAGEAEQREATQI